jgi:alkylation response protein AidB-like acyl-CoA dehydrogenase
MDLALDELQLMLQKSAQQWIRDQVTIQKVREWRNEQKGYSSDVWSSIANMGWIGLTVPEEFDGIGGGVVDAALLFEEIGKSLLPSPFLSQWLSATMISKYATPDFRRSHLPQVLNGKETVTVALLEESGQIRESMCETKLERSGLGYRLSGEKRFVLDGSSADGFLVTAAFGQQMVLVYVSARDSQVSTVPLYDAAKRGMAIIRFDEIDIPAEHLFDSERAEEAMDDLWNLGAIAVCSELTGASDFVLTATVDYAKTRVQFGQPIGRFQAIQHKCANMKIDIEVCRHMTHYAAWMLSESLPGAGVAVSQAKSMVSEAANRIVREGQQIFGGLGFTEDHVMPLYYRYIKEGRSLFGLPDEHRRLIASELLDNKM